MVNIQLGPDPDWVLDGGNIPLPLTIVHGRATVDTQPDPPSMDFEWWADTPPPGLDGDLKLGDLIQVWHDVPYIPAVYDDPTATYDSPYSLYDSTAAAAVPAQHYEGTVVDLEAVGHTGRVQTWRITTVGVLARWGTIPITITRPAETDVARVQAIADAAGLLPTLRVDGAAVVTLAAGDLDTDALTAAHDVCRSSGGLLWQARNGDIHYTTAEHRPAHQAPDLAVDASVIVDDLGWVQQAAGIVNQAVVAYGPATARAEVTVAEADSITRHGLHSVAVDTTLAAEADAETLGSLIVARRAWPYWTSISPTLALDQHTEILMRTVDVNTVIMLPIPRDPGPTPLPDPAPWVVEGWVQTFTEAGEQTAVLAVSDQRRWVTTTLRTYTEVAAMGSYTTVLGSGFDFNTYLDLLVKET